MNRPIGIFDSGLGGLTVANAVYRHLPNERMVYFGDSAHLPYGDKSAATIQAYSVKICDVLLQKHCKLILIACNSASAAAYELVKAYVGSKAKVLNVIDPVVAYVAHKYAGRKVGLIGTKQTVGSGVYEYQLKVKDPSIQFCALPTPLLVPMIEEGFHNNNISEAIIEQYLADPLLENIDTLILGCTHYPLIKSQIDKFYEGRIEVIDSSMIVAKALAHYLAEHGLASAQRQGEHEFLVSDITPSFEKAAELFFGRKVPLEKHILWE
ncbi:MULTISPECIES: glutamate racemase [Roseivirga]|jgi:glutamate racemase|uniref:glutamate racemase n=1 Tax=Roseivirga TaxID=290180 RepID=UPI00257AEB95|nr:MULTISPECIES: glutamate racemase [Roseivirga]MEC7755720.1 glutamate racemase [Bacteroidota bacterium]|tara:strand:- start:579 stop:1379 length:801 start_codon:yes stop_codon:yes gene_type:complete